jgi:PAS domain-containing protein
MSLKMEYKIILFSIMIGLVYILAEVVSNSVFAARPADFVSFLFEPLPTNTSILNNAIILLLCFVFGLLLAFVASKVLKAKKIAHKKDIEKNVILDFVPEVLVYIDKQFKIQWVSRSFYNEFNIGEKSVEGVRLDLLSYGKFPPGVVEDIRKEFSSNKNVSRELRTVDGKYWHIISNPAKDENGVLDGYVLLAIDITESKQQKEMNRRSFEQLESNIEKFATIIDNIRNPLTNVVLLSETSQDEKTAHQVIVQCDQIEEVIAGLDKGWSKSEEIRNFLKEHL